MYTPEDPERFERFASSYVNQESKGSVKEFDEKRVLSVHAILSLLPDDGSLPLQERVGDLLTAMCG
jgi:hypothetical protein